MVNRSPAATAASDRCRSRVRCRSVVRHAQHVARFAKMRDRRTHEQHCSIGRDTGHRQRANVAKPHSRIMIAGRALYAGLLVVDLEVPVFFFKQKTAYEM